MALRNPAIPSEIVTLPVAAITESNRKAGNTRDLWMSLHTCLLSLDEIPDSEIDVSQLCSHQDELSIQCHNVADYEAISNFANPETGELLGRRTRKYCAECLYLSLSFTMSRFGDPDTYKHSTDMKDGEEDPNSMYLVSEELDLVKTKLPGVLECLKRRHPATFIRLNDLVKSGKLHEAKEKKNE